MDVLGPVTFLTDLTSKILGSRANGPRLSVKILSLRYFTVYGPRQRPDIAFHRFLRLISQGVRVHLKEPRPDFMRFCGTPATGAGWIVPKKYVKQVGAMKADDEGMTVQVFLGSGDLFFHMSK